MSHKELDTTEHLSPHCSNWAIWLTEQRLRKLYAVHEELLGGSYELGFPCGSAGKESACNERDLALIPVLGRSPGEGKGYPLQYSCLENSRDCIGYGVAKSWSRLRRKAMTNLNRILKSRGIILLTKVYIMKAMVFPVVMCRCEIWNIKKAECQRIDAFKLWCRRRLLRVPWTREDQSSQP